MGYFNLLNITAMKTIFAKITINDDTFKEPITEIGNITDSDNYCYTDISVQQITLPTEEEKVQEAEVYAGIHNNISHRGFVNGANWVINKIKKQ